MIQACKTCKQMNRCFQFPFLNVSKEGFSSKINLKHLRAMFDLLESSEDVLQVPRLWENVAAWLEVEGPSPNS